MFNKVGNEIYCHWLLNIVLTWLFTLSTEPTSWGFTLIVAVIIIVLLAVLLVMLRILNQGKKKLYSSYLKVALTSCDMQRVGD